MARVAIMIDTLRDGSRYVKARDGRCCQEDITETIVRKRRRITEKWRR